ncbi:iron uptake transporter deferrochelatase/peroxidase subunit [Corynebacterium sp.]|uniref:iron uptake transporter deferrochelatase/peroxidase subunit n=1 Tax=Corynebacterium sp. TaxID=1720 RepID=UPI0026DD9A9C|nr:iron uptake transporter deferrochelatase/peroxidase subunit [Corynebacterium sp.]MDO5076927.1 iron uptake transporter deferrochelatase/peroxidase subunit [Corynebacterium sp.]
MSDSPANTGLSRRGFLALLGAGGAGAAGLGMLTGCSSTPEEADLTYEFYGEHQAGIITPAQDRMHFAAFDIVADMNRDDVIELLRDWTYAASRLTLGLGVTASGAFDSGPYLPPEDTGEAADLPASGLTITFGFGRSLFKDAEGKDRFNIADKIPADFAPLPKMVNDFIDPAMSEGDICVQACAHDPQVAVHAIRNLTRIAFGRAVLRWSQLGFGRTSSTSTTQKTPRNLFGQKDGTSNIKAEEPERLKEHVWINDGWARGGTYLVARRITMTIEVWDGVRLEEQERVTGRDKREGAPLSGGDEFTPPDFTATDDTGSLLIDERSHVARVHPDNNDGIAMMRRGYNFVDGNDTQGRLNAGLFFIAFVKAPGRFAKVHKNMARDDMFIEYLKTTGSAVFLVPPGIQEGQYVGQQLFEA